VKGIYVLIIQVDKDVGVNVGALGKLRFKKGEYAYVGSAQTNLEKRINRHLRKKKRKFWHIDYLLDNDAAKIANVFFKEANKAEECRIAQVIGARGEPTAGFGCSDCKCKSHLFQLKNYGFLQDLTFYLTS
jgi:Uri superfamily endonuclease